mmetsp:Transcript_4951/g.15988  ORF Transcript_4951/g.15988 Transcript_4951/m.15988 type:complete len:220 (-) Transcript_4951:1298-1957(-)
MHVRRPQLANASVSWRQSRATGASSPLAMRTRPAKTSSRPASSLRCAPSRHLLATSARLALPRKKASASSSPRPLTCRSCRPDRCSARQTNLALWGRASSRAAKPSSSSSAALASCTAETMSSRSPPNSAAASPGGTGGAPRAPVTASRSREACRTSGSWTPWRARTRATFRAWRIPCGWALARCARNSAATKMEKTALCSASRSPTMQPSSPSAHSGS